MTDNKRQEVITRLETEILDDFEFSSEFDTRPGHGWTDWVALPTGKKGRVAAVGFRAEVALCYFEKYQELLPKKVLGGMLEVMTARARRRVREANPKVVI